MQKSLNLRFLADESFSFAIISVLREKGYNIKWIGEIAAGISDKSVYQIAKEEDRVILTEDKDFGELAVRFKLKTKRKEKFAWHLSSKGSCGCGASV